MKHLSSIALLLPLVALAACETSTVTSNPASPETPTDETPSGGGEAPDGASPDAPAPADADDPRSVFGAWKAVEVDLFSSDVVVGVAPVDEKHVWVAVLNRGSLSLRMWNGSSWGQPQHLKGAPSQRLSGYGLRIVGKGQAWAYGPGILYHLENGTWVDLSSKLARDATWGADGILALGGWDDESFLTAQTSGYRWSKGALTREAEPPYADVVFGASPDDAWAFKEKPYGPGSPAIYRRKGGSWKLLDFGDAGDLTYPDGAYAGAASLTPGNVWALGNAEVMRQDGEGFAKVARPSTDPNEIYNAVWTTSPNNAWVLGSAAHHWDGKSWSKADSDLGGTYYGIGGVTPDLVWAYGAANGTWSLYRLVPE